MISKQLIGLCVLAGMVLMINAKIMAQARLKINNNSQREMTVKVMRDLYYSDELHEIVEIGPYESKTIFFSTTEDYYTKTKAVSPGRNPVYRKGSPFNVYNGSDGYSVLELTFTIIESNTPEITGGKQISKEEFEKNN